MSTKLFLVLIIFYLVLPHESKASVQSHSSITRASIGVIVDETTRVGKEQKIAIEIAVNDFNDEPSHLKLSLLFRNSSYTDPLQAAFSAMELSKEQKMKAIIGMETWQQAALVAEIGSQNKIPVLSLAPAPSNFPLSSQKWPFLVQMATNYTQQISYISGMVKFYGWKRVVAVYEDDGYDGSSVMLTQLTQALQEFGSEIEHNLALPPLNSAMLTNQNTKEIILVELVKVLSKQSRVFVVLQSSLPLAYHLFKEAKKIGLVGKETVWIVTESIAGLLDSIDSTFIYNMQGVLGIKSYYHEEISEFLRFKDKFKLKFQSRYPREDHYMPSIHAQRAYDGITTIANAMEKPEELLEGILESNFRGLSGQISFNNQNALSTIPCLRIVNVVGKMYKELDPWTPEKGRLLNVDWPGDVRDHVPKGWAMPIDGKPFKVGVPGRASVEEMVKVEYDDNLNRTTYTGFCFDVFNEVLKILEHSYTLPYEFHPFNGTYDELVDCVYNKTFDAVVGDVTILAERSKKVEFTLPYIESDLWMIVPYKSKESQKAWLFIKPFNWQMWAVTGAILIYNMFTLWFLEHKSNPEFSGSWQNQLTTSLWFTFSSLFFAHRENIRGNSARIVILVWLVVVLVLTQSYTANFTSMLTVPLLEPKVRDINDLKSQPVGCDRDSFLKNYLVQSLDIHNIVDVRSLHSYVDLFRNQSMAAAILEQTYARTFLNRHCKDFTHVPLRLKGGGLGFVFQKGSPIAADVSKAILQLSENGVLKTLSDKWLPASSECTNPGNNTERLSLQGFWALYLFSGATSAVCCLLVLLQVFRSYYRDAAIGSETPMPEADSGDEWVAVTMTPPSWNNSSMSFCDEERLQELSSPTEMPEIELSPAEIHDSEYSPAGRTA